MKTLATCFLLALVFSILCGFIILPILKKIKAGQSILKYVETHKHKDGTPTMGGLFFIIPSCIVFLCAYGVKSRLATVALCVGISFMAVGFLDDFIKIKTRNNEGLKPYQKILFQIAISLTAGVFLYVNGLTYFYLPFVNKRVNLGAITIPFVFFIFIAITNSVNLTDGLDGLAGSVSAIYFICLAVIIILQNTAQVSFINALEYESLVGLSFVLCGGLLGFLLFNTNKARVFMGDTGSLALGGFLGAISIFSANSLFIPILGAVFVITALSVIIQVAHYKRTKKRIFLMTPIHHHFQMKGYSESQITYVYCLVTGILGVLCIISYL